MVISRRRPGADRDSELVAEVFDERDSAVTTYIEQLLAGARELGLRTSICGQAPSVYPEYTELLVRSGIEAISVNIDAVERTRELIDKKYLAQQTLDERLAARDQAAASLARSEALARYARAFERAVALRTGLTGRTLAASVRAHMGEPPPATPPGKDIQAADFGRGLARINTAFRRLEEHAHARRSR